jgi:hypothetical protein
MSWQINQTFLPNLRTCHYFTFDWLFTAHLLHILLVCLKDTRQVPLDHLILDWSPNLGPLISCWELDKFKNCWNKSFRTSKILTLLHQQFPNLLISQWDMSGPRLGELPNNRWSGGTWQSWRSNQDPVNSRTQIWKLGTSCFLSDQYPFNWQLPRPINPPFIILRCFY